MFCPLLCSTNYCGDCAVGGDSKVRSKQTIQFVVPFLPLCFTPAGVDADKGGQQ